MAETEEAEPEEVPELVGGVAEVPATQTYPHRMPVTSIGAMARELGIVPTATPVPGGILRVRNPVTTETSLRQLKQTWK